MSKASRFHGGKADPEMKRGLLLCCALLLVFAAAAPVRAAAADKAVTDAAVVLSGGELPILMYHHLLEQGPCNPYELTTEQFRAHMVWLRDNGFTPLVPSDLPRILAGELPMPRRPVLITFDDGYESNYKLATPILRETHMRAAVAVITCGCYGQTGHLNWAQLREMVASGIWEVGSHTHSLHAVSGPDKGRGVARRPGETRAQYLARVVPDLRVSAERIESELGTPCLWLSYPYGQSDPWLDEYLADTGLFPITTVVKYKMATLNNGTRNLTRLRVNSTEAPWQKPELLAFLRRQDTATAGTAQVACGGQTGPLASYEIDGTNYVRLRDLAALLRGTAHAFDVSWDGDTRTVAVTTGSDYQPAAADEPAPLTAGERLEAVPRRITVTVDGSEVALTAYQFHGNNYVNLRWVAGPLAFAVDWDAATQTVVIK
jgi:peptidoglycan/xylan/chitin deacetylase (PgdA/CDA1 family)